MSARLAFAVLVPVALSILVAATLASARTSTAIPSATTPATPSATATASPPPIPTRPAPPEPLPAGCAPGASPSDLAPNAPSDLWAVVDTNPNLPDLPPAVVVFRWTDNSADELCFALERRVGQGPWVWFSAVQADQRGTYGDGLASDEPVCFRVFAGNDMGRSEYSNEACVEPIEHVTATPTPVITPVGCQIPTTGAGPSGRGPAAPSDLRAELVPDPELASGSAVRLTWQDNADSETCFVIAVRMQGELMRIIGVFAPMDGSTIGPMTGEDFPDRTGLTCYQVYYGSIAGQSYSNEACVSVEVLPVWATPTPEPTPSPTPSPVPSPTPLPAACRGEGPVGAPGAPSPPAEFRAMLLSGADVCEGFIVRLRWNDDADNDLCYVIEQKVGTGDWAPYQSGVTADPSGKGIVSVEDVPQRVGLHCYRVYYGNEAGRSAYSDERCALVEVVPTLVTHLFAPTPNPTWPPGCNLEGQTGSPQAPNAPTNLTAVLRNEPGLPQPSFVDLTWDDNSADEACFVLSFQGPWWITDVTGPDQATFSKAAYAERCGMAGYWCYHVSAANEWGMSQPSNEVCLEIEPGVTATPAATPAATAAVAEAAAVGELPTTSGATGDGVAAWWWWALTACGGVLMGMAALSLAVVARRGPSSR